MRGDDPSVFPVLSLIFCNTVVQLRVFFRSLPFIITESLHSLKTSLGLVTEPVAEKASAAFDTVSVNVPALAHHKHM